MESREGSQSDRQDGQTAAWTVKDWVRKSPSACWSRVRQVVGHSEFNLCSVGSCDVVRLNPRPHISTLSWKHRVEKGSKGGRGRRIWRQWFSDAGAKRLNEAGRNKACNKLDVRETVGGVGVKIVQRKGCSVTLHSGVSWRIGRPSLLPFIRSPPCHLVLFSWHHILAQAHTSLLSGEMHALANKSPTVSQPLRFLPRAPFVYSTPSIMQGLISQSRFELQHAWTKRVESRTSVPVEVSPSHWLRGGLLSPFMPLALIFKPSGGSRGIEGGQEGGGLSTLLKITNVFTVMSSFFL